MFLALGIVLSASAFADYEDILANDDNEHDFPKDERQLDIVFMVLGVFFTLFGLFLLGEWEREMEKRRTLKKFLYFFKDCT